MGLFDNIQISKKGCVGVLQVLLNEYQEPQPEPEPNPEPEPEPEPEIIKIVNINDYNEGTPYHKYQSSIRAAKEKWTSVIKSVPDNITLEITVNIVGSLGDDVVGQAQLEKVYDIKNKTLLDFGYAIDTKPMGTIIPAKGSLLLSNEVYDELTKVVYSDGTNALYNVILHEIGHLLGILSISFFCWKPTTDGSLGIDNYVNNAIPGRDYNDYINTSRQQTFYSFYNRNLAESNADFGGSHAVREYNNIFNKNNSLKFNLIPVEQEGGIGTYNGHPEEGDEGDASSNNRYIDASNLDGTGIRFYPGLDKEIMTGWIDGKKRF